MKYTIMQKTLILLFAACTLSSLPTFAQTTGSQSSKNQLSDAPVSTNPVSAPQPPQTTTNKIKLEATFRGSQEQPKVLTIVPWQLPIYSSIKGQEPSNIMPPRLLPLFRKSFISEQKVYEKLFKSNSTVQ